jgi:hypothetical protein
MLVPETGACSMSDFEMQRSRNAEFLSAEATRLEQSILLHAAVLYADEPARVLETFRHDLAERGTALATAAFMHDPASFGSLQEDTGGRLQASRRLAADLAAYGTCLAETDWMNRAPPGTAPLVAPPTSISAYTADMEVQRYHRRRLDSLVDGLFTDPVHARRLLSQERSLARQHHSGVRNILSTDWTTVLQNRSLELGVVPGARPEELAELAGVLRAVSHRSPHVAALETRLEHGADVREQRIQHGGHLAGAFRSVFGDEGAPAAEAAFLKDVIDQGTFQATATLRTHASSIPAASPRAEILVDQLCSMAIVYVYTLRKEAFDTGMAAEMNLSYWAQEQQAARSEAEASARAQLSAASSLFKKPEAAVREANRLAQASPANLQAAVSERIKASGWGYSFRLLSSHDPSVPPAGLGMFTLSSTALAHTKNALEWMAAVEKSQGLAPGTPSGPRSTNAPTPGAAVLSAAPCAPPVPQVMDRFRTDLSQDTYSVDWLPQRLRDRVQHVQVGMRNATITLEGGVKLVDAGPMGISIQGRVDQRSIKDLVDSVASKGWNPVRLSGDHAFKERAFIEFGLMQPPVQISNHTPSLDAQTTLADLMAQRLLQAREPSVDSGQPTRPSVQL